MGEKAKIKHGIVRRPIIINEIPIIDEEIAYHEAAIKRLQERRREEINRQNLNKGLANG